MRDEKRSLSAKQNRAVVSLSSGETQEEAAAVAGVSRSTVERWLRQSEFSAAVRNSQDEAMKAAARRLTSATGAAVETAVSILEDDQAAASVRLSAARLILDAAGKYHEAAEILQRLDDIEAAMVAQGKL